jgi:hypothetical protein
MMKIKKSAVKAAIVLAGIVSLSACFDSDNDKEEVVPVNQAPTAASVNLITQTEVPIADKLSGTDPEGQALTYELTSEPQLGSIVVGARGDYTYQPFDEATGSDMFSYVVRDVEGLEASATVNITIEALQLSFLSYSRLAFAAPSTDAPLLLNGRVFTQDSNDQIDYQDLIDNN